MSNRKIRRSTCVAVCDWWESNGAPRNNTQTPALEFTSGDIYIGCNISELSTINPGDRIHIVEDPEKGFIVEYSYAQAYKRVLNNKIKFRVYRRGSGDIDRIAAVAITGAKKGHLCRFKTLEPGYFCNTYMPVYYDDENDPNHQTPLWNHWYDYVTQNGVATDDKAQAYGRILWSSKRAPYDATGSVAVTFCKVLTNSGGGSGGGGGGQGTLMTKTVATGLVATVSNGYCTLSVTGTTIKYYGEP